MACNYFSLKREQQKIINQLNFINQNCVDSKEGSIKAIKKGNKFYYVLQHYDHEKKKYVCSYQRKDDIDIAKRIVYRDYYKKAKKILLKKLERIKLLLAENYDKELDDIYSKYDEGKKALIKPIPGTVSNNLNKWYSEKFETYLGHPEKLIHDTERGEYVRSKSEGKIADYLYSKRDVLDYRYEAELSLYVEGKKIIIHPDFTIINLVNGKIYYLEHVSRLDLEFYHDKFVWKYKAYLENGFIQNGLVLFSFESENEPLTLKQIKYLVNDIILSD